MNLERYLDFLDEAGGASSSGLSARQLLNALLPAAVRGPLKQGLTRAIEPYSRARARRLAKEARPLRLHLGCGVSPKLGWLNVDLLGANIDLAWDVSRALPFATGQVDAVFHEHLLEHLSLRTALALTRESHRVLREGGVLRIAVPDSRRYLESYTNGAGYLEQVRPGRPTPLLAASEVFLRHGHRSAYDFDTLALLCAEAGFTQVDQSGFGAGRLRPCPDGDHRRPESLYVEAVKGQDMREAALEPNSVAVPAPAARHPRTAAGEA